MRQIHLLALVFVAVLAAGPVMEPDGLGTLRIGPFAEPHGVTQALQDGPVDEPRGHTGKPI